VLALFALRAVRTRRHRRRGARGAWSEVLDLLALLRRRPGRGATAPDIAAELDAHLGTPVPVAARIAEAADREAFAFGAPGVGPAVPEDIWRDVRMLRRRARARLPWLRKALFRVSPRPLLRR
jgi:hypothetical protein